MRTPRKKPLTHFTLRVTPETMAYFQQFPSPSKQMREALHGYVVSKQGEQNNAG